MKLGGTAFAADEAGWWVSAGVTDVNLLQRWARVGWFDR